MRYAKLTRENLPEFFSFWNKVVTEEDFLYKPMDIEQTEERFFASNKGYVVTTYGAWNDTTLVGFSSGVFDLTENRAFITMIVVDESFRKQGIGSRLLDVLEEEMCSQGEDIIIEVSFRNPKMMEWVVPHTEDHDHPNAPGVSQRSDAHHFFLRLGYEVFAVQHSYYRLIEQYQPSSSITKKRKKCHDMGLEVVRYDSNVHSEMKQFFIDTNTLSWYDIVLENQALKTPHPILIAVQENRVVGFTGPLYRQDSGRGYFAGIAIHPSVRGMGLGSVLFSELCVALKQCGAEYMTLFTGANNPARFIYEKEGFNLVHKWVNMRKKRC